MHGRQFKPCCKKTAIQAFFQQIMASHKMNAKYPLTYDVMAFNGKVFFMLP